MGKKHQNVSQAELFGLPAAAPVAHKKVLAPVVPTPTNTKKKTTALSPTDIAFAGTTFPVNDPAVKALRKKNRSSGINHEDDRPTSSPRGGLDVLCSPRSKLVSAERSAKLRRDVALGKRRVGDTKVDGSSSGEMLSDASTSDVDGDEDISSFSEAIDLDDELCADNASNTSDSSTRYGTMNQGGDGNDDELSDQSSDFDDEEGDDGSDVDSITSSILAQLEAEGVLDDEEGDEGDEDFDSDDDDEYADAKETLKLAPQLAAAAKKNKKKGAAAAAPVVGKKRQRGDDEDFIIKGAGGERQQMVHFDGFPYTEAELENSLHLLDSFIPDHMLEVDRDAFAALLRSRDSTIIIKQGDDESDDEKDSESEDAESSSSSDDDAGPLSSKPRRLEEDPNVDLSTADDIFGIYSMVDLCTATNATKKDYTDISIAFRRLMDSPWLVLESGVRSIGDLLGAAIPNSRLLVMDCLKTIPPDVSAAALQSLVDAHGANSSFQVVVLAKAQRSAEAIEADYKTKKANKKSRVETPAAPVTATVNLKEYVFWRLCEEVLYEHRDPKTSVTLYKNRSQYDEQPDLERPLSIGFSLTWDSFKKAVKECAKRASETTGYGAM